MKKMTKSLLFLSLAAAFSILLVSPATSQDQPDADMQILLEKIRADKKLLVAANMDLTEEEAKNFWPVYQEYQAELEKINRSIAELIGGYAEAFNKNAVTDELAEKMIGKLADIEEAEVKLMTDFVPKLKKALPAKKAARYLQIENKIRAIIKCDMAEEIPLVP